jgi:FkbM family methyltransferase
MKFLRVGDQKLIKIHIPKYNYKVYCPANKNDLMNFTVREDDIIERFCPKEGDIVIDVGAHFGRYTIIASKRVGPNGKVIAIEAHPQNFELLNCNIKLNNLNNIISLNYAAFSKQTTVKLYLKSDEPSDAIYNTLISNRVKSTDFLEVQANTLDYLLQSNLVNLEKVNWIKIDVEGAELEVLRGSTNVLANSKDIVLLIEIHTLPDGKNHYETIMDLLSRYNFNVEFEKTYGSGEKHVILRKLSL